MTIRTSAERFEREGRKKVFPHQGKHIPGLESLCLRLVERKAILCRMFYVTRRDRNSSGGIASHISVPMLVLLLSGNEIFQQRGG